MRHAGLSRWILVLAFLAVGQAPAAERQLTNTEEGHMLTNSAVWSADGQWIAYDTRKIPESFDGTRIELVNARTGEVRRVYESQNGAACGVASFHPVDPKVVFILGPENPTSDWTYALSRRRGAIVDLREPGVARPLDAMNYAPPFTPGALRGGSHVHMFSGDGKRFSFTYDDEFLARSGVNGSGYDVNERNIGVGSLASPVRVNRNHPRNNDGDSFCTVVTRTVPKPQPGSDEIGRACEEGWIGRNGYLRPDGTRQPYALAFQGLVTAASGERHFEVYVVDLPDDLTQRDGAPLEGTATTLPAPPQGTTQRRITHTDSRKYPGIQGVRHWLRCAPDGSQIAFLMRDDNGVSQIWLVSPNGGEPHQLTHNAWDIGSTFTWSPDGKRIAHAMDGSVFATEVDSGHSFRLTEKGPDSSVPQPYSCVFSPDGKSIAYARRQPSGCDQLFVVDVPPLSSLNPAPNP